MKLFRVMLALAMVFALSPLAKADDIPVDFQMVVIDPPPSYLVYTITDPSFSFTFSDCVSPGQIPSGTSFVGCFTGQNETGQVLTSLHLAIPFISGQVAGCDPSGTGLDIFSVVSCSTTPTGFLLDFSGGSIGQNDVFTIAEAGVDPSAFPEVEATFNPAPEPNSALLLSTGVLMAGGLMYINRRRREAVVSARS